VTKVSFYTLGCKSNQYETDAMARIASSLGAELVPYPGHADIYVINTCTVTGNAAKKSRHAIRFAKKINPNSKVIATGCDVELEKIKEADLILNNNEKPDFKRHLASLTSHLPSLNSHLTSNSPNSHIRANLLIEDGCENFCSYCIVPYVRGKVRSRPADEILNEAKVMVDNGVKEIVLTGINIGEFTMEPETFNITPSVLSGHLPLTKGEKERGLRQVPPLISLINGLSKIEGLLRIRLSSIEPMYVDDALIKIVKENPKVCKHLHIPMQSGDDGILKAMNRNYTAKGFEALIKRIKNQVKDIAITTDIIVGFPGEEEAAFKNTCKLVDKLQFSRIHIFSYSDRPKTAATKLPNKVDPKTMAKRHEKLDALRAKYMLKFHKSFSKNPMEVLIEQKDRKTGLYEGLTTNYIRVFLEGLPAVARSKATAKAGDDMGDDSMGKLFPCKFKEFRGENVIAKPILL